MSGRRHFKILVLGDVGVGKTSIIEQYVNQRFSENYKATFGADFQVKLLQLDEDHRIIRLHFWDIAGQERFVSLTRVYYKDADACIIVADLTKEASLRNAIQWKQDLDLKCRRSEDGERLPSTLLGNKADLPQSEWTVTPEELASVSRMMGCAGWATVSARRGGAPIDEAIRFLVDKLLEAQGEREEHCKEHELTLSGRITLTGREEERLEKRGFWSLC